MITLLLAWMALALAGPEMIPEQDLTLVGRTAPPVEGALMSGERFSLQEQRGEVVVLSFWASWCGPCRAELPALSALQKGRPDVKIYAINVDKQRGPAQKFLRQVHFDLPVVWDNNSLALGGYNVMSMPTMFLIDPRGTVKWTHVGYSQQKGLTELEMALDEVRR